MSDTLSLLAGEAEAANAAIADSPPYIADPPDLRVELLRGLLDPVTGQWHTTAVVREMTGADEEALASLEAKGQTTYGDYMTALLARTVESIGSIPVTEEALDRLILGDRDLLFLGVVRATYGNTKDFQVTCRRCDTSNDITVDLTEDFPVKKIDRDLRQPVTVKLRRGSVKVRLPDGADTKLVGRETTNLAEQNTMLISRCVVWESGRPEPGDKLEWAKNLGVADRQAIVKVVLDQPGPEMEEVKAPCAECGQEMTLALDWASLLLA